MNNSIAITSDDISCEEFLQFITEKYGNESSLSATIESPQKEGRAGLTDFLIIIFANPFTIQFAKELPNRVIYDLLKWGFSKLGKIFGSKPKATITMKNGITTTIPATFTNEEIRSKIIDLLLEGDVQSIHFDS